jgi:uncharacterized protein (DUF1800 family)
VDTTRSQIAHLYRRAGFGARAEELDAATTRGYEATVEILLAGLTAPDPTGDGVTLPQLTATPPRQNYIALSRWWIDRMVATSTPLREKLALLWHGHFATGFTKVRRAELMYRQNQLFRTLGGGNFETLTQAVAKDAAMQVWLDTVTNVASHPNENFARELMELFTLGVGNYREEDVRQAARCFTGWAFNRQTGDYVLRRRLHDEGPKTVTGQSGNFDGTDVVRILTHQPASARFVVTKLWSHLAYPLTPADPVVSGLVPAYQADLDITRLLRAIFLHPQFLSPQARAGLVKQPIEYVVGIGRTLGLPASGAALILQNQEPFNPPNVSGWGQNEYWLNTATAQLRLQWGHQVAAHADLSALEALPAGRRPEALAHQLSIDGWGQTSAAALNHVAANPRALVALGLSAPEYVLN